MKKETALKIAQQEQVLLRRRVELPETYDLLRLGQMEPSDDRQPAPVRTEWNAIRRDRSPPTDEEDPFGNLQHRGNVEG